MSATPDSSPAPQRARSWLHRLLVPIGVTLGAAVFVFEELGWQYLQTMMRALARLPPIARLEAAIQRLGPYPALALFLVPIILLEPLKLLALWLLATGHVLLVVAVILFAKLFSTALVARLFHLSSPALLSLPWFRRGYEWTGSTKDPLHDRVKAMPAWQATHQTLARAKGTVYIWGKAFRAAS